MNVFFTSAITTIPFLFFQIDSISSTEIWIHRVGLAVCFILIVLLLLAKQEKRKRIKSSQSYNAGESNDGSLELELNALRQRVQVLETNRNSGQSIKKEISKSSGNKVKLQSESELGENNNSSQKLNPNEVEEEIPSLEIDLPLDKRKRLEEEKKSEIFYLSSPDKDKAFFAPEATFRPNEKTMYSLDGDCLKLYDRIDEQTMRLALNSLDILVKRVCEVQNAKEPQHTKIVMIEPGKVIRERDDFLVTSKMKVKFE